MKSLTRLWVVLANEVGEICGASTDRDCKTVMDRVEDEGLSFLTITLPSFCTDFERSLADGRVSSDRFPGFARSGGLPRFLSGFLRNIFDHRTGVLLDSPDIRCIRSVRQLLLLFKKLEMDCTPEREAQAVKDFIQCEEDIASFSLPPKGELEKTFTYLFGNVLSKLDQEIANFELKPSHGPGATADGNIGNAKFVQKEWTDRLEEVFPFGEFALPSWRHFDGHRPVWLTEEQERPVKVTLVPKTLKSPRVIAIEPTCMQYMQQAVSRRLVSLLETDPICSSFIGFTDQEPNRRLAHEGSITGDLATIDLKEASDRVSWELVERLVRPWTNVRDALDATRSRVAKLPLNQGEIPLRKFASMGSALCFPVEAMVFVAITFLGIQRHSGHQRPNTLECVDRVRVYGDDIVVPADSATAVMDALCQYGMKVNTNKSFWTGKFRESCGGDYYDGVWVTPLRCKSPMPSSRRDAASLASWIVLRNAFWVSGFPSTANWMKARIEEVIPPLPHLSPSSSGLGWIEPMAKWNPHWRIRWNHDLQKVEIQTIKLRSKDHQFEIDGAWALQKCLSGDWSDPMLDGHLESYGRSPSVSIKKEWAELGS